MDEALSTLSLLEVQQRLARAVSRGFPEALWLWAEIYEISTRVNGHCYLKLAQQSEKNTGLVAKADAVIWASDFRRLRPYFETVTGQTLAVGIRILVYAKPTYHELYGLSLTITDINPQFTLGDVALARRRTLARLDEEGVLDMNRTLPFPALPLRLAVVSAEGAAGYRDFVRQLLDSPFPFQITLFDALMQGTEAPRSIIAALERIDPEAFDVLLLLRGGGAAADMHCFDDYSLCAHLAQFPLPLLTGIGHDKDEHIADRVACVRVKTPTAAAEYLIDCLRSQAEAVDSLARRLEACMKDRIHRDVRFLDTAVHRLALASRSRMQQEAHRLDLALQKMAGALRLRYQKEALQLEAYEQRVVAGNPLRLLEKGYSLTLYKGKPLRQALPSLCGEDIEVVLAQGALTARVTGVQTRESKENVGKDVGKES